MTDPKEKQEDILIEQDEQGSECSKDSDCGKGQVCIRGRCVDELIENES
jgi:Cys-rich repeat protein